MIVVSLTSWKKRIQYVKKVVESIMKNTVQPDRVYLNLSKTEFEGIQVTSDCLYLTVAYHQRNSDLTTLMNRIYQVEKF